VLVKVLAVIFQVVQMLDLHNNLRTYVTTREMNLEYTVYHEVGTYRRLIEGVDIWRRGQDPLKSVNQLRVHDVVLNVCVGVADVVLL
jgi:hypothetical protein